MAANSILINIGAKTADAVRDVNKFNRSLDGTKDSTGKLSKSLKGPMKAAAGIAAAAIAGAAVAAVDFGKAALEDRNEADKLAYTLDRIPGITQKMIAANAAWIDSMELATSVADTQLRESVSKLALATGDLGEAQTLTALAADVSAASSKSLDSVTTALAKAVNGNTTALQRQFPWLDKDKDGTVSLDEATKGLTKRFKGAAEAASNRDPFEKLKVIWGQLREALGQYLLPIMDEFITWFKDPKNQKSIQNMIDKAADLSLQLGTYVVDAIKAVMKWLSDPKNKATLREFSESLKTIAGFAADVAGAIGTVITKFSSMWDWMQRINRWTIPGWLKPLVSLTGLPGTRAAISPTRSSRAAANVTPNGLPVMVSDEQLARAVGSLLARSGVRNGIRPGIVL
jgi:hypothetical protein